MALAKFIDDETFSLRISKIYNTTEGIAKIAIYRGMAIVADAAKRNLEGVVSRGAASELVGALGITPMKRDKRTGAWNGRLGFDGYQNLTFKNGKTKKIPFQMLARVIEGGAVFKNGRSREGTHFMRRAVESTRAEVQRVMGEEIKRRMNGR